MFVLNKTRKILLAVFIILLACGITLAIVLPLVLTSTEEALEIETEPVWRWECIRGFCQKLRVTPETRSSATSLQSCRLFCSNSAALWPQPTGELRVGPTLAHLNVNSINFIETRTDTPSSNLVRAASDRFRELISRLSPRRTLKSGGRSLAVTLDIVNPDNIRLTLDTDESYTLHIGESSNGQINATIVATTYFGSRHGLETLGQLILYDDIHDEIQIAGDVTITDGPVYPYRGILLDTSRNYISADSIKRTLDGMGASKLNTLHWHITDTHSFPYVSTSQPFLSAIGAYSPSQVYTREDVAEIVQYGKERGVRVMPEFDAPAHVGEGWQETEYVICFNQQPFQSYCYQPPCGQLDPTLNGTYEILEGIYRDMVEQFDPDIFHMGGDEVSVHCWNSTQSIVQWMSASRAWEQTHENFIRLWDYFQSEALNRFDRHSGQNVPIILWTSQLTENENVEQYLPIDRYIIQIWTTGNDTHVSELLERGYRIILSNHDALYLDCGFGAWTTEGNNWCSPYKAWHTIYTNSPAAIAGDRVSQVVGSEVCLWTEQADDASVDGRIWPRAAALAERLWAEPSGTWREAQERMMVQRQRLITRGIAADALEPEWCRQNEQNCPQGGEFNT